MNFDSYKRWCLEILEKAEGPLHAIQIAAKMGLRDGNRESRKRTVRALVEALIQDKYWIVSNNRQGYWLTNDEQEWRNWLAGKEIEHKGKLGRLSKLKRQTVGANQGSLFDEGQN